MSITTLTLRDDSTFELEVRTDISDLQQAIEKNYQRQLDCKNAKKRDIAFIIMYERSCIQLFVDKQEALKLKYKKMVVDGDWVSVFYEGELPFGTQSVVIQNTFLVEMSSRQANIFKVKLPQDKSAGYHFAKSNPKGVLDILSCKITEYEE